MNKHLYRIVFNRARGVLQAVAEIAPLGELQERLDAGAREGDDMLALQSALLGSLRRRFAQEGRQTFEIRFAIENELIGFLVRQHILRELRAKSRQPFGDGGVRHVSFLRIVPVFYFWQRGQKYVER